MSVTLEVAAIVVIQKLDLFQFAVSAPNLLNQPLQRLVIETVEIHEMNLPDVREQKGQFLKGHHILSAPIRSVHKIRLQFVRNAVDFENLPLVRKLAKLLEFLDQNIKNAIFADSLSVAQFNDSGRLRLIPFRWFEDFQ